MKLAISNIAWPAEATPETLAAIRAAGCTGVEVAPTRVWSDPSHTTPAERGDFRTMLAAHGLSAVAIHSLMWGRDDLGLFRDRRTELETQEFLIGMIRLAADLGALVAVFGSPRARRRGGISDETAFESAAEFFARPAKVAAGVGVCLAIEPLSSGESDFINSCAEGLRLTEMVGSPGFGLHVDAKSLADEGQDCIETLSATAGKVRHFHVNDPGLVEVGSIAHYHEGFGRVLRDSEYGRYVSIEMKTLPDFKGAITRSIARVRSLYLGSDAPIGH